MLQQRHRHAGVSAARACGAHSQFGAGLLVESTPQNQQPCLFSLREIIQWLREAIWTVVQVVGSDLDRMGGSSGHGAFLS
jgi:hypothetical protein